VIEDVRIAEVIEVQQTIEATGKEGARDVQVTSYYLKDGTHLKDIEIVRPKMKFKIQPGSLETNFDGVFKNLPDVVFANRAETPFMSIAEALGNNPSDEALVEFMKKLGENHKIEIQIPKEKPE